MNFLPWSVGLIGLALVPKALPPVKWTMDAEELGAQRVMVRITARVDPTWHIYAMQQDRDDGPLPTVFRFTPDSTYGMVGELREPEPEVVYDPNFGMSVRSHQGVVVYELLLMRRTAEAFAVALDVEYMACDDKTCLPPVVVPLSVRVPALSADPK